MHEEPRVEDCMALRCRRLARLVTRKYDAALRPSGLRVTQFTLLHIIGRHPGIGINPLASATDTDPTTLTRNLSVLERNGWVTIGSSSDDQRRREVRMTDEGRRRYEDALPRWAAVQKEVAGKTAGLIGELEDLGVSAED